MKYAIIIPSLQYGDTIKNCITSLLESGYDEDIYVVSPDMENSAITALGDKVRFVDTVAMVPEAPDTTLYRGFLALEKKYDILIYSHSDMLFNAGWWQPLKELWDSVDKTRVWNINVPQVMTHVLVTKPNQKLGLAWSEFNPGCHSRLAPVSSFLCDFYAEVTSKYGGETSHFNMEHFLYYEAILQHKWQFMANIGGNVVHVSPNIETAIMEATYPGLHAIYLCKAYESWFRHFGYNLEHFIVTWFGNVMTRHTNEIIDCANDNNYEALDYIFDEGIRMLKLTDCDTCSFKCPAAGRLLDIM